MSCTRCVTNLSSDIKPWMSSLGTCKSLQAVWPCTHTNIGLCIAKVTASLFLDSADSHLCSCFQFSLTVNNNCEWMLRAFSFEISSSYVLLLVNVFLSLVSACPWVDAFSSDSPIYQSDVAHQRSRCYVQRHGACTESLSLTLWPAY